METMSAEEYHAHEAIGSTTLKYGVKSMAKLKAKLSGQIPDLESDAFNLGTAVHSAILEKDVSQFVNDDKLVTAALALNPKLKSPRASKSYKVDKEALEGSGKTVLKADQFAVLEGVYNAFFQHKLAGALIKDGLAEKSFFATIKDQEYKCRPDYLIDKGDSLVIVDLKTAQDCTADAFSRSIGKYRYDLQAAHYKEVVQHSTKKEVSDFFWVVVETEAPYELSIYRADNDCLSRAYRRVWRLYNGIDKCKATDVWPGIRNIVQDIDLTSWDATVEEGLIV
jgi:ATP-dependent exoDNAse (exonuclease V) beta subunit